MATAKELEFAATFQRRWRNYAGARALSFITILVGIGLRGADFAAPAWTYRSLFVVGFLGLFLSRRFAQYKCPRCDTTPVNNGEGFLPSPVKCVVCNLAFRQ